MRPRKFVIVTDVLENPAASIFRVKEVQDTLFIF